MRRDDERIKTSLSRRLDRVQASPELWARIESGMDRSRRLRRIEAALVAIVVLAGSGFVVAQVGRSDPSGSLALAPGESPDRSPSVSPAPEPSPTASPSAASPAPAGMIHFVTPDGDLEFNYPQGWDQAHVDANSGLFVSWNYDPHQDKLKAEPGDMKLEFSIGDNSKDEDLNDLQADACTPDPAIESIRECGRRDINGRTWVWSEKQANKDFDRAYSIAISTVVEDRVYGLLTIIFRGEDATEERIGILEAVLESVLVNA